jgi:hypothetical protein
MKKYILFLLIGIIIGSFVPVSAAVEGLIEGFTLYINGQPTSLKVSWDTGNKRIDIVDTSNKKVGQDVQKLTDIIKPSEKMFFEGLDGEPVIPEGKWTYYYHCHYGSGKRNVFVGELGKLEDYVIKAGDIVTYDGNVYLFMGAIAQATDFKPILSNMKKSDTGFCYEYEYKGKSYKFYRKNTDEYIEYNLVPYINIDKIPELKEMPNIKAILDMVK